MDPMAKAGDWVRLGGVAGGYAVAFGGCLVAFPGSATSPWFVGTAMVCVLGLASVAEPVVPLRVPAAIGRIREWEARGRIYRALGVQFFGALLRRTPLRLLNTRVYLEGSYDEPTRVLRMLESAEASHLLSAALTTPFIVYAGAIGRWGTVFAFVVAQLVVNLYPIAHTRLARHRVERVVARASRRLTARTSAASG